MSHQGTDEGSGLNELFGSRVDPETGDRVSDDADDGWDTPKEDKGKKNDKKATRVIVSILLVLAMLVGGYLIVWDTFLKNTDAPMPTQTFTSTSPDTYEPVRNSFVPQLDGPRIVIESIEMEAKMFTTDKMDDGFLELPPPPDATWYKRTQPFGAEQGKSLIAGHVDLGFGSKAPFNRLHNIQKGAPIEVEGPDGEVHMYEASSMEVFDRNSLPEDIFSDKGEHELIIVTCSGPQINSGEASYYEYNLVVRATPMK